MYSAGLSPNANVLPGPDVINRGIPRLNGDKLAHCAARGGLPRELGILKRAGANLNVTNKEGATALQNKTSKRALTKVGLPSCIARAVFGPDPLAFRPTVANPPISNTRPAPWHQQEACD